MSIIESDAPQQDTVGDKVDAALEPTQEKKGPKVSRYSVFVTTENFPEGTSDEDLLNNATWEWVNDVEVPGNGGQREARKRAVNSVEEVLARVEDSVDSDVRPVFIAVPASSVKPAQPRAEKPRAARVIF